MVIAIIVLMSVAILWPELAKVFSLIRNAKPPASWTKPGVLDPVDGGEVLPSDANTRAPEVIQQGINHALALERLFLAREDEIGCQIANIVMHRVLDPHDKAVHPELQEALDLIFAHHSKTKKPVTAKK